VNGWRLQYEVPEAKLGLFYQTHANNNKKSIRVFIHSKALIWHQFPLSLVSCKHKNSTLYFANGIITSIEGNKVMLEDYYIVKKLYKTKAYQESFIKTPTAQIISKLGNIFHNLDGKLQQNN